jgi:hypothetical protein
MRTRLGVLVVMGATLASLLTAAGSAQAAPARTWEGPKTKADCMAQRWKGKCVYMRKSTQWELPTGWYIMR